jgi:hypothetical protein
MGPTQHEDAFEERIMAVMLREGAKHGVTDRRLAAYLLEHYPVFREASIKLIRAEEMAAEAERGMVAAAERFLSENPTCGFRTVEEIKKVLTENKALILRMTMYMVILPAWGLR